MKPIQTTGILVTRDVRLMDTMNSVMDILDVHTTVCMDLDKALRAIEQRHYSCMLLDWQSCFEPEKVMNALRNSKLNEGTFALALTKNKHDFETASKTSANMVCNKSEVYKCSLKHLKPGHVPLIPQKRGEHRHAVQWKARISDITGRNIEASIADISVSGVALQTKLQMRKDDTMKVSFAVPGEGYRAITATTRVKWSTPEGQAGLQFSFIPAQQKSLLEKWLAANLFHLLKTRQNNKRFDQFSKTA